MTFNTKALSPAGFPGVVAVIVGGTIVITLSVALFCCFCNGKGGAPEDSRPGIRKGFLL